MAVVQAHLAVPVWLHDDGSADGLYDLQIRYPDGRVGAVEVTAAEDPDLVERQSVLSNGRAVLRVAGLRYGWLVVLNDGARVKTAQARLPQLLRRLEAVGRTEASVFSAGDLDDEELPWLPAHLVDAQVQTTKVIDAPAGTIAIIGPMRAAFLSRDPEDVVTFVEQFIESRPTDIAKLRRADADERHLFIWGGEFSIGWVPLRALQLDVSDLPVRAPGLPPEITHVWLAPEAVPPSRIVMWSATTTSWVAAGTVRPRS